ncbi:hypothetical protein TBLA_0F02240 [Henningerozyma blattae CBS 6284]|uniref:Uncharacterized protein n=1 Tax=Henningerozyma blattae (strain ATCC 34711 / CBS 6284 / DSM 70876 / NBRC 10599 / NRRL Y-10934 / UCD 77-7) TaxID=1071380 RepID=I2H5W4_HENB6|nr:hypothetical protein TBLA_0F02240 [Tetrapisispora blattae CBS 6284]CCH61766.1 hypothetical protein TBLA_0F02240 [Tetrapisispora blattae CBS 6284]
MSDLNEIYDLIRNAEQLTQRNDLLGALKKYREVETTIGSCKRKQKLQGNSDLDESVIEAIELLQEDISLRIREIESLTGNQRPISVGNNSKAMSLLNSWLPNNNNSIINGIDFNKSSMVTDPLLISIIDKLKINILMKLNDELEGEKTEAGSREFNITQQFNQFNKELLMYEQKKFNEYNLNLEQLAKENRKLSKQIIKLKERWDSLVASAKEKRNRQLGE